MSSIPSQYQTEGYQTVFGDTEARAAIAIAEVSKKIDNGSSLTSGSERQAELYIVNDAGIVAAGFKSVTFANIGNAPGTILGVTIPLGVNNISWKANAGDTIAAIDYDATGTMFLIAVLR